MAQAVNITTRSSLHNLCSLSELRGARPNREVGLPKGGGRLIHRGTQMKSEWMEWARGTEKNHGRQIYATQSWDTVLAWPNGRTGV